MMLSCRLKQARESRGLTQLQLCELLGTTEMTLYRWENGKAVPRLNQLKQIATITNKTLYWFFTDDDFEALDVKSLSPNVVKLIKVCNKLNGTGQAKILSMATDLAELTRYSKEQ